VIFISQKYVSKQILKRNVSIQFLDRELLFNIIVLTGEFLTLIVALILYLLDKMTHVMR